MPPYEWDDRAARFRDRRTGRYLPTAQVRAALDRALDDNPQASAKRVRALAESLRGGGISLDVWRAQMITEIRNVHLSAYALALGGYDQLAIKDFQAISRIVARELGYLEAFTRQIASGQQALDGRLVQRAEQYARAGRATFHATERALMDRRGFDEERSELAPADHCEDCVSEAGKGWQPIGEMIPVGARRCKSNCRCRPFYRNSVTGEERAA